MQQVDIYIYAKIVCIVATILQVFENTSILPSISRCLSPPGQLAKLFRESVLQRKNPVSTKYSSKKRVQSVEVL